MSSSVLTRYQFDLVIGRREAKKFLEIMNDEAGDLLDRYNKEPWLKTALDELYRQFIVHGRKIKRRALERMIPRNA